MTLRPGRKYLFVATFVAMLAVPVASATTEAEARVAPTSSTAAMLRGISSDNYCWFCNIYEDYAWNPVSEQNEIVTYAYCTPIDNYEGGAVACFDYPNMFNTNGEWEGTTCWDMWAYTETGWSACDCTEQYEFEQLFVVHCNAEVPAGALSSDGYLGTTVFSYSDGSLVSDDRACNGAVKASRLSEDNVLSFKRELKQLVI